jgi:hypothetical protein
MVQILGGWIESVDVADIDGQLVVTIAFRRDADFEADLAAFNASVEAREEPLAQLATLLARRVDVAVTAAYRCGPRTDCWVSSGGTGTENLAVWRYDRVPSAVAGFDVTVQADGQTVFRTHYPERR